MSIAGQWITKYTGSNSGLFIAEFDEVGNHYEGTICVWDSKPEYPNSSVYISTESNCFPQHFRGLPISHFDNLGTTLFPTTVQKLKENRIVLPETVDCTLDMKGNDLHVIWRTSIGTTGSAFAPKTKAKRDSELKPLSILTRWRGEAEKKGRRITRIAVAFEAGHDGFWLARWLEGSRECVQ